jgi:hypothetical protein
MPSAIVQRPTQFSSRRLLEFVTPVVTVVGVMLFVVLRSYYGRFYGALGVDPSSVGLDYVNTFASSVGILLFVGFAAVIFPGVVATGCYAIWRLVRYEKAPLLALSRRLLDDVKSQLSRATRVFVPAGIVIGISILSVVFWFKAAEYADAVRSGRPVKFGSLAVTSFAIRASPVDLSIPPGADPGPVGDALITRSHEPPGLLYLGQANGTGILYDSRSQQAVHIPLDQFVLRISNCEVSSSPDPRCRQALD